MQRPHRRHQADALARRYSPRTRRALSRICSLVVLLPWALFVALSARPAILASLARRRPKLTAGLMLAGTTLKDKVEDLEKQLVSQALARNHWNQSRAAVELGLSRVGLANKIKRYGLEEADHPVGAT